MKTCRTCLKGPKIFRKTDKIDKLGRQVRQCMNCGSLQSEETPPMGQYFNYPKRVFYFDIETAKMTLNVETFQLKQYSNYLSYKDIVRPTTILCWAGVWIENGKMGKVIGNSVKPGETKKPQGDDKRCATLLRNEMHKADYWVGHNNKSFDTKKVLDRFIVNAIPAPDLVDVKQQDTLSLARKFFKSDSNRLDYWMQRFEATKQGKDAMTGEDWDKAKAGNIFALRKMLKYCKGDVKRGAGVLLEMENFLAGGGVTLFK